MAADSNCIQNNLLAEPLQTETRLLLTVYRNSSSPYPTIPLSTPYDVRFSHNTCVTDRRQMDDMSYPRLDLTVSQKGCWKRNNDK